MLKKWYLVKCTKDKFKVDENLRKKLDYMNKIGSDKGYDLYEWFSLGSQTLDVNTLRATYYKHEIVDYQDWDINYHIRKILPKQGFFRASKGLSFILKDGEEIGIFYPHPHNFKEFSSKQLQSYIYRISEHIFGDGENLKLIKYDVSSLNDAYPYNQRSLSFSHRNGGVQSGTLYGESMVGDTIYVEARKGTETYSVYIFDIKGQEYRIGVSKSGSIVTFNNIERKEFEILLELYKYLRIAEKFG